MFVVRPIEAKDVEACAEIINFTIRKGGTTANEVEYSVTDFDAHYRLNAAICLVVEVEGRIVGFQGLFDVGNGVLSVGSFTDQRSPQRGAGKALIEASCAEAKSLGFTSIVAKITADNESGLGYYSKVGFIDDHIIPNDHIRNDGRVVDRIVKRMVL